MVRQFSPNARNNPSTRLALLILFTNKRDRPGCWRQYRRGKERRGKEKRGGDRKAKKKNERWGQEREWEGREWEQSEMKDRWGEVRWGNGSRAKRKTGEVRWGEERGGLIWGKERDLSKKVSKWVNECALIISLPPLDDLKKIIIS